MKHVAEQIGEAQAVLLGCGPLKQHYQLQDGEAGPAYEATAIKLLDIGVDLPASSKAKALAAALGRADVSFARRLLSYKTFFGLPEVLKAAVLLDAPRQLRQLRKELRQRLENQQARCRRLGELAGLRFQGEASEPFLNSVDSVLCTGICKRFQHFHKVNKTQPKQPLGKSGATLKLKRKHKLGKLAYHEILGMPHRGTVVKLNTPQGQMPTSVQPKALEPKKLKKLQGAVKRAKLQCKVIAALQHEIACLEHALPASELPEGAHVGVSGATAKHIRRWIRSQPKEELVKHVLMDMPHDNWARLADLVHPAPSDFTMPWFLQWVHTTPGTLPQVPQPCPVLQQLAKLQALESPVDLEVLLFEGVKVEYSFIRRKFPEHLLSADARSVVAGYASVTQLIWHLDDGLDGLPVLEQIVARLERGEEVQLPFGKLVERMLMIQKRYGDSTSSSDDDDADSTAAEGTTQAAARLMHLLEGVASKRLAQIDLNLPSPVLVLGDASTSMQVCVETSAIVGCMLAAITSADITFFHAQAWSLPTPRGAPEILQMAEAVEVDCGTAPAAGLVQAYQDQRKYATIIVVTDEEENEAAPVVWNGGPIASRTRSRASNTEWTLFAQLLQRYKAEVSPDVQVVFVSFLSHVDRPGYMVEDLRAVGIEPKQFKMDQRRPDLTKLDSIFAVVASNSSKFVEAVEAMAAQIATSRQARAASG